ncbi:MAG TPA: GntR family transcriptional regulator [Hyphomicrobiaceae bacterium]|jgi:DNA-binding GntR family transcriptional regulator|nr:GntR family transcriptional regulator [Hyphomicrobiaceae bacterium]
MTSALVSKTVPPATPARPETLTEQAYNRLEEMIVTLSLAPGAVLSEQTLSATLGIGRTPIREALQRLGHEGLVRVLPRKAIIVTDTDPKRQLLVLEVRRELERLLARASAERATEAERLRFRGIADGMEAAARTSDDIAFLRLDRDLNALLAAAAHNEYAARSMRFLNGHSRRFWYLHYKQAADLPKCARLHADEARAIAKANPARAMAASDKLIDYVEAFTRTTVTGRR